MWYHKKTYRGEFWKSYEKCKKIVKKLIIILQSGQSLLQSGTGFGYYKVGHKVLQSGAWIIKWSITKSLMCFVWIFIQWCSYSISKQRWWKENNLETWEN